MIWTHIRVLIGDCKVWVWRYLTPRQWAALAHITIGAAGVGAVCTVGIGIRDLLPPAPPSEQIITASPFDQTQEVPEPGTLLVLGAAVTALILSRHGRH